MALKSHHDEHFFRGVIQNRCPQPLGGPSGAGRVSVSGRRVRSSLSDCTWDGKVHTCLSALAVEIWRQAQIERLSPADI